MKNLLTIAVALLIAGTVQLSGQKEGDPAPDFAVDLQGGGNFELATHEGKVVFVFFFGNTCPSCLAVGASIESSIYQLYKEDTSNFIAIGLDVWDNSSNEASVSGFRNKTGISFPLGLKAGDVAATYTNTYDRLMVIDKQGILVHKGVVVAKNDIDNAVEAINQSLTVTGFDAELDRKPLTLYPNPVSDVLHIKPGVESISGIELFDVTGKQVLNTVLPLQTEKSSIDISVRHLETGIYIYSVRTEGSSYSGKLLIQR
jgi:peroxiredoxin